MPGEEPPEIAGQIRRRRVAPIALLRQCAPDDRLEVSVQRRIEFTQPRRLVVDDAARKFGKRRRIIAEGQRVGQQSEQEDAERVDIRACVDPARARQHLLGAHEGESAHEPSGIGGDCCEVQPPADGRGDAEVQQLGLAVWCDQDVGRLQVTVEDAALVGVLHRITHERRKLDAFVRCQLPCVCVIRDRRAHDQLHRDERRRGVIAGMSGIDMGDAGVLELAQQLGLHLEAPADCGCVESPPQDLHGDRAGRVLLARQVDDARRTRADDAEDREPSDACSGRELDGFGGPGAVQRRGIEEVFRIFQALEELFHLSLQDAVACTLRDEGAPAVFRRDGCEREEDFRRALGGGGCHARPSSVERIFPAQDLAQPGSRERPFRFHRRGGQIQCGGCFLDRQAGEVAQHDDLCFTAVETLQLIERAVDRQHVVRIGARCGRLPRHIHAMLFAAVFQPMTVPRTLDEDAAHRDGRGGEEVPAAVPAAPCTGIHPQVCLVHERGGLERQRVQLPPQAGASQTAQLLVDLRQELCGRTGGTVRGLLGTPR